jgi:hypothetical protein
MFYSVDLSSILCTFRTYPGGAKVGLDETYFECQVTFLYNFVISVITEQLQGKFLLADSNHHL